MKSEVTQSCPTLCDPMDCSLPGSSVHRVFQARVLVSRPEYWSGYLFPSPGDLPNPGIEPRSLTLQADSLQAKPQGKPKNTGVGSLFLLQWISPTQELNQDLLHCRQILYQLSSQGSPLGPREKTMTSQKPRTDLPACLIESSGEVGAAVPHCRVKDIGGTSTKEYSLA